MKTINLGTVTCSEYAFGMWRILDKYSESSEVTSLILELEKIGINTLDTAQVYGGGLHRAERILSDFCADQSRRERFKIITKAGIGSLDEKGNTIYGFYDFSKANILNSVDNSLKALNTNYIDVFLLHRPDYFADFKEIAEAFAQLKAAGKVIEFGVSNFTPIEFASLQKYLSKVGIKLVTNQIELNPFTSEHIDNGNLFYLKGEEISPMIWSPYGGGRLFAKNDPKNQVIYELANKYNICVEEVVCAYLRATNTNPIIILGSNRLINYQKIASFKGLELSKQEIYQILSNCADFEVK